MIRTSLIQDALDLGWINVFAASLDHVFGAIDEIERAVVIASKHVAHVKPPAAKIACVGVVSFPIAGEQRQTANGEFSGVPDATSLSAESTSLISQNALCCFARLLGTSPTGINDLVAGGKPVSVEPKLLT